MKTEIANYSNIVEILKNNSKNKLTQKLIEILEKLQQTIKDDEIVNPEFTEVKYYLNHIVDFVFKTTISEKYLYAGKYQNLPESLYLLDVPSETRSVVSFFKKLDQLTEQKNHPYVQDCKSLQNELTELVNGYNFMKNKVVKVKDKRKKEKEIVQNEQDEWNKNLVNHKDVKVIVNLLNDKAKIIHNQLMQLHLKQVLHTVNNFKKKSIDESNFRKWVGSDTFSLVVLQQLTERKGTYQQPTYQLVNNYAQIAEHLSEKYATEIVNKFSYKNTHKIGYILTEKNNLKTASLNNIQLDSGRIECDLNCIFLDGSRFIANTSVVLCYSKYSKPFYRYPTVFRDVVLSNGERLENPSEQRMEDLFAKDKVEKSIEKQIQMKLK